MEIYYHISNDKEKKMVATQKAEIAHLKASQLEFTNAWYHYWHQYSNLSTWEFWVNLALLVIPLIVLYLVIDRKKALLLGFFGFNVHVWFTYLDAFGVSKAWWFYPYKVLPIMPVSFALDVSFIPVTYMLVYQWILHHQKNYYLYMFGLSLLLAFIFKPLMSALGLFQLSNGANYFHLFLSYFIVTIISKMITNVFIYFEKQSKETFS